MKRLLLFQLSLFLLTFFPTIAYAGVYKIALTFDDLPAQGGKSAAQQLAINKRILNVLKEFQAPATGFVNENKLYKNGETQAKIQILQRWIKDGHDLGNHTYSHHSFHNTPPAKFFNDIQKGSLISAKLMKSAHKKYTYFRHPYLHTGTTEKDRASLESFLSTHGYVVAPVTVDTDDWKFEHELQEKPQEKEKILAKYLAHTKLKFLFYQSASEKIYGRNISHIWLLHSNQINAYALADLLKMAHALGYTFISLKDALKDNVYQEPDHYYAPFGVSWLYRWDYTRGKVVDWSTDPEPDNNPFIQEQNLNLFDSSRNRLIPVKTYVSAESYGKATASIVDLPVVILNHGYGVPHTAYSFIANALAKKAYFVISIQHDNKSDPPLPGADNLFTKSMPIWERGMQNISFVMHTLKKEEPHLNLGQVTLIGHANGGDIAMMFATKYPQRIAKVISLDSLHYPFPTEKGIPLLHFAASDTLPDAGVIPEKGVETVFIPGVKHMDFCDKGRTAVKEVVLKSILQFLK